MSAVIVLGFLALSLFAYVTTGGADFGVGMLELWVPRRHRSLVRTTGQRTIAPIWEANHIWIVVALVILFVGFPEVHVTLATQLHIPMLLMLAGIVVRGTAFTFRYYDVSEDRAVQRLWSVLFRLGSLAVPLVFGHLAAALSRGRILATPTTVFDTYVAPWVGWFPLAVGLFVSAMCTWLAAVFLVGETTGDARALMAQWARRSGLAMLTLGGMVSVTAWLEGVPWFVTALGSALPLVSGLLATVAFAWVWRELGSPRAWSMRIAAGATVFGVLSGYWGAVFPVAVERAGGPPLTWFGTAAPAAVMDGLASALLVAGALVVPGLVWLYRLFSGAPAATPS